MREGDIGGTEGCPTTKHSGATEQGEYFRTPTGRTLVPDDLDTGPLDARELRRLGMVARHQQDVPTPRFEFGDDGDEQRHVRRVG